MNTIMNMNIRFPFAVGVDGRTATADPDAHVRQMIEQLLFTVPGERVNRPDFGSGLLQLVFTPNSPEQAAAVEFSVSAALQRWLSDVITVEEVAVTASEADLAVTVRYLLLRTGERTVTTFQAPGAA